MEVKKRSGEKRGAVLKLGGMGGGGGGLVMVVGGALVAAAVWSVCEFRRRRRPSSKKETSKDLQTPNLEKVKNVDRGEDESQTEEKDVSAQNLRLGVEKRSELGIIEDEEEKEIQEGKKIEDDETIDGNIVLFQKEDGVASEAVHETMQEGAEFCDDVTDVDTLSSVSEEGLAVSQDERIMLIEKMELIQFVTPESVAGDAMTCEKKGDEVVPFMTSNTVVDDGSKDAVSEDLEYEDEDGSEGSSRGTTDSSAHSNAEAAWPVESLEVLSKAVEDENNLTTGIQSEIIEADDCETISFANGIHHNKSYDGNISIDKEGWGSDQMVGNSTTVKIWISTVLLALLVLLGALLAQRKYFSPAPARNLLIN